jgi:hypothetical protein
LLWRAALLERDDVILCFSVHRFNAMGFLIDRFQVAHSFLDCHPEQTQLSS